MATNKTANYELNQWIRSDPVCMDDFNSDNQKLDAALKNLSDSLTVSGNNLNSSITTLGNRITALTKIKVGSYTGSGASGSSNPNTLTFDFKPQMVIVFAADDATFYTAILKRGSSECSYHDTMTTTRTLIETWTDSSVLWSYNGTSSGSIYQLNSSSITYWYIAIG